MSFCRRMLLKWHFHKCDWYFMESPLETSIVFWQLNGWFAIKRSIQLGFYAFLKKVFFFNFMAPFYGSDSTASRLQPLQRGSLLFTIQFPEIPGTHYVTSEGWKAEQTLEPPSSFEQRTPGLGIQHLKYSWHCIHEGIAIDIVLIL